MSELNCLGAEEIGFEYMDLAKAGAGLLQGAGSMLSAKQGGGMMPGMQQPMMQQQQPMQQPARMSTLALIAIGGAAVFGLGGIAYLIARK